VTVLDGVFKLVISGIYENSSMEVLVRGTATSSRDGDARVRGTQSATQVRAKMPTRLRLEICLIALVLLAAGCGGGGSGVSTSNSASPSAPELTATPPAAHLDHISISPSSLTVAPGAPFAFTASPFDQYNKPFTAPITWSSDGNLVTGGAGTGANATQNPASSHIVASSGAVKSNAAILTVSGAPSVLTSATLTPLQPTAILTGQTQQFSATGFDQFGNTMQGIQPTYSSSDPTVATMDVTGKATVSFTHTGTTVISANVGGMSTNTSTLVVNPAPSVLYSVVITPNATTNPGIPTIPALTAFRFVATEFDQFNQPLSIPLAWATDNGNATVSGNNSEGVLSATVNGVTPGVVKITVTVPTVPSFTVPSFPVTISSPPPPVLTSLSISPSQISFNTGSTQQFTVNGVDQYGNPLPVSSATWAPPADGSSSVSSTGLVTGNLAGPSYVTVSAGAVTGTVFFALTTPPPPPPIPPAMSALSPPMGVSGSGDLQYLTIAGTNFAPNSVVNFGSDILAPVGITATSITVQVPAADLISPATVLVTVTNPGAITVTSNPLNFVVSQYGFVSIDFDDGYQSMYDNGLPLLDAVGIKTSQYIVTGSPNHAIVNPDQGPVGIVDVSGNPDYLSWAEVQTMAANGHEIGAHTRTHQSLSTLCGVTQAGGATKTLCSDVRGNPTSADDSLDLEIAGSKADLIAQGLNPLTFAYPYGDYGYPNPAVGQAVQTAGYVGARDSDLGYNGLSACSAGTSTSQCNHLYPYYLWSQAAENDMNTTQSQVNAWMQYAQDNKIWLIILLHRVDDNRPGSSGISIDSTPATAAAAGHAAGVVTLQGIVDYLVQNGITTVTNSQGLVIENLNGQGGGTFQFPQ
jgi:peptidoglycan/xylan/chitin deacetylase (PgdA/CDA1 family)